MTFKILISPCGESEVDYPVTEKERRLIRKAKRNYEGFSEVAALDGLYQKVMKAARQKIEEDLDIENELGIDPDDLSYCVTFDEMEE